MSPTFTSTAAGDTTTDRSPFGARVSDSVPARENTPATAITRLLALNEYEPAANGVAAVPEPGTTGGVSVAPEVFTANATVPLTLSPSRPSSANVPVATSAKPVVPLTKAMLAPVMSTPIASGLAVPSASREGPLPMNSSRPVPEKVPSEPIWNWPARISRMSPKSKSRSCTMNANRGLAARATATVVSPTAMVWLTATPVVLMLKPTEAPKAKLPPPTAIRPVSTPATPPVTVVPAPVAVRAAKTTSAPLAPDRPGLSPPTSWLEPMLTPATASRVTW